LSHFIKSVTKKCDKWQKRDKSVTENVMFDRVKTIFLRRKSWKRTKKRPILL